MDEIGQEEWVLKSDIRHLFNETGELLRQFRSVYRRQMHRRDLHSAGFTIGCLTVPYDGGDDVEDRKVRKNVRTHLSDAAANALNIRCGILFLTI